MMRDSDYIKASVRREWQNYPSKFDVEIEGELLFASHAVADDVMRELAEALRDAFCAMFNDPLKLRAEMLVRAISVLDRYDKLIGDFDD